VKVAIIDPWNFTPYYDYSLCRTLGELGCRVEWITSAFLYESWLDRGGVRRSNLFYRVVSLSLVSQLVSRLSWVRWFLKAAEYPLDLLLLLRHIAKERPAIVHYQWVAMPLIDGLVMRLLRRWGIKVVYTAHDVLPHRETRWPKAMYSSLYAAADAIVVHAEANRVELLQYFPAASTRVHVIPQGGFSYFGTEVMTKEEAKKRLGLAPEQLVILFFGVIKPYKGLQYLIRAFQMVKQRIPQAKLLIAGYPNERFYPYERLIANLGLAGDVVTRLGFVPTMEVTTYFCAANVVALPYVQTSHSAVLFTAYTFGRPVVVTTTGGLPEAVELGQCGYVVPPRDEYRLAEAISDILADESKVVQMGERAHHLAETTYFWPNAAQKTLELYKLLLEEGDGRRVWRKGCRC
jgi:glycosyltransferase involved in cell wall biosynthesis